ncbi:hypothetical protein [Paludisphaera borealis]|uniref:hypothetical protein n=1 Tax=Paludisphaera borealis TaxID=1387353 RepID=UPI0011AB4E75|nr:hypothetical protein [Paludisphaera borealis]
MSSLSNVCTSGSPRESDPAFDFIVAALSAMPPKSRHELLAFLDFWRELSKEDRAVFAKSIRPGLTEEAVALLSGVTTRQLHRYRRYREVKVRLADYLEPKRRRWYLPAEIEG